MIRVVITKSNQHYKEITLNGHAGFDEYGKDIVCSAVSTLVINAFNSIEKMVPEDYESEDYDAKQGFIHFVLKDNSGEKSKLLIDSMLLGLEMIKKQYGSSYLKVNYKEV